MQSTKAHSSAKEVWSSSTLKLDRVHGLKEILAFDGEASTSTLDIDNQEGYWREVGTRFDKPKI